MFRITHRHLSLSYTSSHHFAASPEFRGIFADRMEHQEDKSTRFTIVKQPKRALYYVASMTQYSTR